MTHKILIVENDIQEISSISSLLSEYFKLDILIAYTCQDAKKMISENKMDMALINFDLFYNENCKKEDNFNNIEENSILFYLGSSSKLKPEKIGKNLINLNIINLQLDKTYFVDKIKQCLNKEYAKTIGQHKIVEIEKELMKKEEIQNQLERSIQEAEKANYYKTIFLANMSHDIRTPLNGILGVVELLQGTDLSNEQKEYIKLLKFASLSLNEIIDQILDISKIESGKMELDNKEFDISSVTNETVKLMEFKAKNKNLNITFYKEGNVEKKILGDIGKYKQILMNLLNNAIKFTDKGRIDVRIRALDYTSDKVQNFEIIVRDTGIGIDKAHYDKIFNEFEQANPTINNKYGGTGLGLAIVKKLLEIMGGSIKLESTLGAGSSFFIKIPFEVVSSIKNNNLENTIVEKKQKILVVDDNEINRAVILKMLEKQGFYADEAENGLEAYEKQIKNQYDIIFMDIQMPIMDGIEATKVIREKEAANGKGKKVEIVAVTACIITFDKEMCIEAGMDEYVIKPIKKDTLLKILGINNQ